MSHDEVEREKKYCYGCQSNRYTTDDTGYCKTCRNFAEEAERDHYYDLTTKSILVPVEVKYHDNTSVLISFTPPTLDQVEKAYQANETSEAKSSEVEMALRNLLNYVVSGRRYETTNPYFIKEVKEAFKALELNHLGKKE
jgi:hypothetical protein